MILTKPNEEWKDNGRRFYIGQRIVGTDRSEYEGLFGTILEIRDGEDRETENKTPDIYCSFDAPVMPHDVDRLEQIFSDLYGEPKKLEEICLDSVMMAPEMIEPLDKDLPTVTVYVVTEDWAYRDEAGFACSVHSDWPSAIRHMRLLAARESDDGLIRYLKNRDDIVEESNERNYEIYVDGFYCESHCAIAIKEEQMQVSPSFLESSFS